VKFPSLNTQHSEDHYQLAFGSHLRYTLLMTILKQQLVTTKELAEQLNNTTQNIYPSLKKLERSEIIGYIEIPSKYTMQHAWFIKKIPKIRLFAYYKKEGKRRIPPPTSSALRIGAAFFGKPRFHYKEMSYLIRVLQYFLSEPLTKSETPLSMSFYEIISFRDSVMPQNRFNLRRAVVELALIGIIQYIAPRRKCPNCQNTGKLEVYKNALLHCKRCNTVKLSGINNIMTLLDGFTSQISSYEEEIHLLNIPYFTFEDAPKLSESLIEQLCQQRGYIMVRTKPEIDKKKLKKQRKKYEEILAKGRARAEELFQSKRNVIRKPKKRRSYSDFSLDYFLTLIPTADILPVLLDDMKLPYKIYVAAYSLLKLLLSNFRETNHQDKLAGALIHLAAYMYGIRPNSRKIAQQLGYMPNSKAKIMEISKKIRRVLHMNENMKNVSQISPPKGFQLPQYELDQEYHRTIRANIREFSRIAIISPTTMFVACDLFNDISSKVCWWRTPETLIVALLYMSSLITHQHIKLNDLASEFGVSMKDVPEAIKTIVISLSEKIMSRYHCDQMMKWDRLRTLL